MLVFFSALTILGHLGLIHLQLQPGPVEDLVDEYAAEEDLGKGTGKGTILVHLDLNSALRCDRVKSCSAYSLLVGTWLFW